MTLVGDSSGLDQGAGPSEHDRVLLVTSLRRRGMTGVQTHLAEAERVLAERFRHVDIVSLDTLLPVKAGAFVVGAHVLSRIPHTAAQFARWRMVGRALELAVAREVRRRRPDVVYAQDIRSAGAAIRARGRSGYAVVMVVHFNESEANELVGLEAVRPGSAAHRELEVYEREVLRRLDGMVFVSDYMRRHVLDEVPEAAGVPHATLPNVLDRPATPAPQPPITGDCITVGMLVRRKNHRYLLEVLAAARAQGRDYRLTIVGDGAERHAIARHAAQVGVADLVTFTGRRDDVDALLRGHRVYVHSAVLENAPYAIIEAMRAGLPVVTSAVGGIPEVVGDAGAGAFWQLDDPDAGAAVLTAILEDDSERARRAAAAADRFATVYDEAVAGNWLGDFLSEVVARRG